MTSSDVMACSHDLGVACRINGQAERNVGGRWRRSCSDLLSGPAVLVAPLLSVVERRFDRCWCCSRSELLLDGWLVLIVINWLFICTHLLKVAQTIR